MPDTGAPWNIPYVAGTDLVKDWPTDNQTMAEAIADALDLLPIRQVISTTKTDTFSTTSTSFADVTGLSVTVTPSSATNKILVITSVACAYTNGSALGAFDLLRGATSLVVPTSPGSRTPTMSQMNHNGLSNAGIQMRLESLAVLDSPATTSATTYKVQARITSAGFGPLYVNRSATDTDTALYPRGISTITVMEVAA